MTFYYQIDLFILFWPRALTLGKSQFDKTLNSVFFSNTILRLFHSLKYMFLYII
jgi:hypothetical protein